MSFGTEIKHCEKCGELTVRKDTEMQWFCKNCDGLQNKLTECPYCKSNDVEFD